MTVAFVGIGANLSGPLQQVKEALSILAEHFQLISQSSYYESEPVEVGSQPNYINAVACIETEMMPLDLIKKLLQIEAKMGRKRAGVPWGQARPIDLDLLLYGDEVIASPELNVPHPRMYERAFVLVPLYEIAPKLSLPDGRTVKDLLASQAIVRQKIKLFESVSVL